MAGDRIPELIRRENSGFNRELGIRFAELKEGYARAELTITSKHLNPYGAVHGGCIFSLMDTAGGAAAVARGNRISTSSGSISFMNAATQSEKLIAEAEELKNGKHLLVYDVTVKDESGRLIAKSTITYFRLPEKIESS